MKQGLCLGIFIFSLFILSINAQNTEGNESSGLINLNPDPNGEPWLAGGITYDDWSRTLPPPMKISLSKSKASSSPLPPKVDNTTHPAFRPVFNQRGGSCAQASGVAYLYTYEINVLRGLSSNVARNQYPYDFTYNFLNSGSGKRGTTAPHGWEILRTLGVPDVETYGGFGLSKFTQWVSGYDIYYKGMSNRLKDAFKITIKTASDVQKMKQFLFDHSDGSPTGGILTFGANTKGEKLVRLASGTPEAGTRAIVLFGTSGGHAMTIAGYNDSVRYDYNGDGKYTNDIDLNGDNKIDVRDWEIGAVYMVNSWGTRWGTNGKAYIMYKVLAEGKNTRGIWNNAVSGITLGDSDVTPQLTYKVKMKFDPRSGVRIRAGFSTNTSASRPSKTKSFGRAFSYTGGTFPMQGISKDVIEFGLDVSEFLPQMTTSEAAFFLQIESRTGSGVIEEFSLIDYTSGQPVETVCQDKNVALTTGTKYLKIAKSKAPMLVVSPNGGEAWELGRTFDIKWSTKESSPVEIELLKNGKHHSTLASSAPATGSFSWDIPESFEIGTGYSIRITNKDKPDVSDESNESFAIEKQTELKLTAPNTSDYLSKGSSCEISWNATTRGDVLIDLYRKGIFEKRIASITALSKRYTWKIPEDIPSSFNYRIRITSKEKEWLYDESDSEFVIGFPVVKVPYTQSFDAFEEGDALIESWEQEKDDDINWTILKGATPSKTHPQGGGTGPNNDKSGSGKYIYVEASSPNHPGKEAKLLSPVFDVSNFDRLQASLWLHMFSRDNNMGAIWVDVCYDGQWKDSVLYLDNDNGDKWFRKTMDLPSQGASFLQLRFRVLTGTDYDSDICIDEFSVSGQQTALVQMLTNRLVPSILIAPSYIRLVGHSGIAKIYSINGKLVLKENITSSLVDLDISTLSRGTFVLHVNRKSKIFIRPE